MFLTIIFVVSGLQSKGAQEHRSSLGISTQKALNCRRDSTGIDPAPETSLINGGNSGKERAYPICRFTDEANQQGTQPSRDCRCLMSIKVV